MNIPYSIKPSHSNGLTTTTISTFLGNLFQFRDKIHLAHLKTTSFEAHVALGSLYESLLDQIDTLVETAQAEGILSLVIPQSSSSEVNESVAEELLSYVRENRHLFPYSYQSQIIDNIEEFTSQTVYKLKFLK